ncbi:MAG: signal peptidase II [Sulfitobacter sp.]|jgi:signal peptidase II
MRLLAGIALIVFAVDQISKWVIIYGLDLLNRGAIDVLPPFLNFRMGWNQGVNFGLFANDADTMRWVLIALALIICVFVGRWALREGGVKVLISAGLLIGGALGNVLDRVIYGAVADFLNMSCCGLNNPFTFNIADVFIFAGAIGLILWTGKEQTAK